ncbi:MAG: FliH/SctL family protein [Planctomycetota bacterium]|nr:FliH/SctL family protein [Planctomycetota bacterium]
MAEPRGETARLVKVDQLPGTVVAADSAGRIYRFQDLREKHERMISDAGREAETVLEAARVEAESIRQKTFDAARQDGWDRASGDLQDEVQRRAAELVDERIGEQLRVLETAVSKLSDSDEVTAARWQSTALTLAVAIAGKLLRRQLELCPEDAAAMVSAALQLSAGSRQVEIRLHPLDLELFQGDTSLSTSSGLSTIPDDVLVADETLERGDCRVQTTDGHIDARLETLLERIAAELLDVDDVT